MDAPASVRSSGTEKHACIRIPFGGLALAALAVLAAGTLLLAADGAEATHLRGGNLTWDVVGPVFDEVLGVPTAFAGWEVRVNGSIHHEWPACCTPFAAGSTVGAVGCCLTMNMGNGQDQAFGLEIVHHDTVNNFTVSKFVPEGCTSSPCPDGFTYVYDASDGTGPFQAYWTECCRIVDPPHVNNPHFSLGGIQTLTSNVTLPAGADDEGHRSPRVFMPPVVDCRPDAVCMIPILAHHPLGHAMTYRWSTPCEATSPTPDNCVAAGFRQPGGPHAPHDAVVDSINATIIWDTSGADLSSEGLCRSFYSAQIMVEDGTTNVPVDWLINICDHEDTHADFTWSPGTPCSGQAVTFTDASQPQTNATLTAIHWDFGHAGATWGPGAYASGWQVTYTYPSPGAYEATVTVWDSLGGTANTTHPIEVDDCEPPSFGPSTWAAGGFLDGFAVVAGNDPGCGLGAADSFNAASASQAWGMDLDPASPGHLVPVAMADLNGPRGLAGGANVLDTLVVAGGTEDCTFTPLATTEVLAGLSSSWTSGPTLNQGRISPAAASDTERMWVVGGDVTGGDPGLLSSWHRPTASVEQWDPSQGAFWATNRQPMPAGLTGAAAVWDEGLQRLVVTGGVSHPQVLNRAVQTYDPATDSWDGAHLPVPRVGHRVVECGGSLFTIGGVLGEQSFMYEHPSTGVTASVLRLVDDAWLPVAPLPEPRAYHGAVTWAGNIVVFGGWNPTNPGNAPSSAYMAPCTALAPVPSLVQGLPWIQVPSPGLLTEVAASVSGTELHLLTGSPVHPAGPYGRTEAYCVAEMNSLVLDLAAPHLGWSSTDFTNQAASLSGSMLPVGAGATTLPDGRIVHAGGRALDAATQACTPSRDVFIYDPVTDTVSLAPGLPIGVSGPVVASHGFHVVVAGGDGTVDSVAPVTTLDDRPRRPSSTVFLMHVDPLAGPSGWGDAHRLPVAVVHGSGVLRVDGALVVVGGSHHLESAVRMLQGVDLSERLCLPLLPLLGGGPCGLLPPLDGQEHLPAALAHHDAVYCPAQQRVVVSGGILEGAVYRTVPGPVQLNGFFLAGSPQTGWTTDPAADAYAFPVAVQGPEPVFVSGTKATAHRTDDRLPVPDCTT